jgi:hypothetical protein
VAPEAVGGLALGPVTLGPSGGLFAFGRFTGPIQGDGAPPPVTTWTSTDGLTWTRGPATDAFDRVRDRWDRIPLDAVATDAGFVAVGMSQFDDGSQADAAAWISPDGATWSPAMVGESSGRTMGEVVRTAKGLVAFGARRYDIHAGFGDGTAIWTSPDGRSWTRLEDTEAPPLGVRLRDIVPIAGGWLATARGEVSEGDDGLIRKPVTEGIWRSPDALRWSPLDGSPTELGPMAAGSDQVVALASQRVGASGGIAVPWRSADGATWATGTLPIPDALAADDALGPTVVARGDAGWIAVAEHDLDGGSVLWFSADGSTWQAMGALPAANARVRSVTGFGGAFLVTGDRDDPATGVSAPFAWRFVP